MPPTIIDPKTDKSPKIYIPDSVEKEAPSNAPHPEQIEKWQDLCEKGVIYKRRDCDPKSFEGRCFFTPTWAFPSYDSREFEKNLVTWKFNVQVLDPEKVPSKTGKGMEYVPHMVNGGAMGEVRLIPYQITVGCKEFLDAFVAIE
jgi:hypothetical protein